jgi:lysine biosynthesis protein LysW
VPAVHIDLTNGVTRCQTTPGTMVAVSMPLECPICGGVIELDAPVAGAQVDCPDCGELFLITALQPLKLGYALDMEAEAEFADEERPHTVHPG